LKCEICKEKFPESFSIDGQTFKLLEYEIPSGPHAILRTEKGVFIVDLVENLFYNLGRGTASDIKISDISVSRLHCRMLYRDRKLYLIDCQSKFGTLL